MTIVNVEFYDALISAGAPEEKAKAAARYIADLDRQAAFCTKPDMSEADLELALGIAKNKTEIIKWVAGLLVAQAVIVAALIKLL